MVKTSTSYELGDLLKPVVTGFSRIKLERLKVWFVALVVPDERELLPDVIDEYTDCYYSSKSPILHEWPHYEPDELDEKLLYGSPRGNLH